MGLRGFLSSRFGIKRKIKDFAASDLTVFSWLRVSEFFCFFGFKAVGYCAFVFERWIRAFGFLVVVVIFWKMGW